MEFILHILGLCPDNHSHIDFLDLIGFIYSDIHYLIKYSIFTIRYSINSYFQQK